MQDQKTIKGSILVFSLIVLTMLLISAITVITVAVLEKKAGLETQKSVLAFQAADSGAERIVNLIYDPGNSPTIALVPLNSDMHHRTLSNLATDADGVSAYASSVNCVANASGDYISGTNNASGLITTPGYQFRITFYRDAGSNTFAPIDCTDADWRDKTVKIKSEGFFRGTSRVVEIGIRPRT